MSTKNHELYALLIGVDCYLPNQLPGGYYYQSLSGCVRDIKHVEAFLTGRLGMKPDQVLKLTASRGNTQQPVEPRAEWPTYENMVAKFKELINRAKKGDQVYIHYSGHGGRALTAYKELKGENGLDETLVPTDIGNSEARYLRDVELAYLLQSMVEKGLIVTIILDSCHSGGATRGVGKATPRTMMPNGAGYDRTKNRPTDSDVASLKNLETVWKGLTGGTRAVKPESGWLTEPKGYTLLAACRANESAYEDFFNGQEKNGALTYWLLDTLNSLGAGINYEMLYQRLLGRIRGWMVEQTPQLQGEGDRVIFGTERLKPRYGITVMQFDEANNRIALNAGEIQGIRLGNLLAVYQLNAPDLQSKEGRLAMAEITEVVGESDSWATIVEKYGREAIEPGFQAVVLGTTDHRLQRVVGLALDDASMKRELETSISAGGSGFIRLANPGEAMDFQVALSESGAEYEIWDRTGTSFPNLRPSIKIAESDAADRITRRLVHLSKYLNVQSLNNPDHAISHKLRVELIDPITGIEKGHRLDPYPPGAKLTLRVHNLIEPNPLDPNDPTRVLNITVLDLQADWGITQVFPAGAGSSDIVQPGKFVDLTFETYLPPGFNETRDIMKVFATQRTTGFRCLELPALDQPVIRSVTVQSISNDPLEQLISALTDDAAPSQEVMRTRSVKLLSVSGEDKPWAVAQVEFFVKKG